MANPKLSEALYKLLPGEEKKRIRQAILLAATAGKSEARTVKAEIAQENRLKTGVMAVGTIDFTSTTSADLDLFAWVIDFAIFQPGLVTLIGVEAPNPTYARPDIFTGNALGQITYYAGTVDAEGNAQFPELPIGEVLLRTVIRQPNGDNDIDDSIPSSSEWVSKSATGIQAIASNLALAPLAGTNPNILTAGPNGELARTNPALAGVFSTLEGIGGFTKILTITIDPAVQLNYFAVLSFYGISTAYEKGQLWVQFNIDGSGDIITNKLQCFGEFDLSKYTLVKTSPTTYGLYVAHDEASSFYKFKPEPQFGSSFRYVYHQQLAKVDPLPAGTQHGFSKYSGVVSVTGDGVDNTDPSNPVLAFPTPAEIGAQVVGDYATQADITAASGVPTKQIFVYSTTNIFSLSYPDPTAIYVTLNGQVIEEGASYDWVISGTSLTVTTPLSVGDEISILYYASLPMVTNYGRNIDGGNASSVYLPIQHIDGGGA